MDYSSSPLQNLYYVRILGTLASNPRHKPSVVIQPFEADMFLDADGNSMQWANGFAMLREVRVEGSCTGKRTSG
jgi:hypothetical protein